ncbi:unnamed protein product, partial [Musa acuminata subsp. burmannicoides]
STPCAASQRRSRPRPRSLVACCLGSSASRADKRPLAPPRPFGLIAPAVALRLAPRLLGLRVRPASDLTTSLPRPLGLMRSRPCLDSSTRPRAHSVTACWRALDHCCEIYLGATCLPLSCTSAAWCPSPRPRVLPAYVVLLGRMALATTPARSARLRRAPRSRNARDHTCAA